MIIRAVLQVLGNLAKALWLTGAVWVVLTLVSAFLAYVLAGSVFSPSVLQTASGVALPPFFWTFFMVSQSLNFLVLGYLGPKWHRAILAKPGSGEPFPYTAYLFGVMQLTIIGSLLGFTLSRMLSAIAPTIPGPLSELTLPLVGLVFVLYIVLRFAIILPAIALNRNPTLPSAWRSTRSLGFAILTATVLLIVLVVSLQLVPLLWTGDPWVKTILRATTSWAALLLCLSFLNILFNEVRLAAQREAISE